MNQDYWDRSCKQRYESQRDKCQCQDEHDRQYDRSPANSPQLPSKQYIPSYQIYIQPKYPEKNEECCCAESYQEKKFDYRYDNRYYKVKNDDKYYAPYEWKPAGTEHVHDYGHDNFHDGQYDEVKPAGLPNKYSARITDLLTSVRDPEFRDRSISRLVEANKGYIVMVRFRPSDLAEVITAVQGSLSTLTAHNGYCIGFSEPNSMRIITPSHQALAENSWWDPAVVRQPRFPREERMKRARHQFVDGPSRYASDSYSRYEWEQRHARQDRRSRSDQYNEPQHDYTTGDGKSTYAVACFWFKDYIQARNWFQTGNVRFKQPEFPCSNPFQVVAVPLTYGMDPVPFTPDTADGVTLLWSEYPGIHERYQYDFFSNYSMHERKLMKRYGGHPYVSVCKYEPGDIPPLNKFGSPGYARWELPSERVARSWRGCWISPNAIVTISTFPSMGHIGQFYNDRQYQEVRQYLPRYTEPVTVAITLRKVQGTWRR